MFQIGSRQYIVIPGRYIYVQRLKGANVNDKVCVSMFSLNNLIILELNLVMVVAILFLVILFIVCLCCRIVRLCGISDFLLVNVVVMIKAVIVSSLLFECCFWGSLNSDYSMGCAMELYYLKLNSLGWVSCWSRNWEGAVQELKCTMWCNDVAA